MKKDPGLVFRLFLMLGDVVAIVAAFLFAYLFRTQVDQRPYYFESEPLNFTLTILLLIPIWLIVLAGLGLYHKSVFLRRTRLPSLARLFIASLIGIMAIISYDFFRGGDLFPVRPVAALAALLCFILLSLMRALLRFLRRQALKTNHGLLQAIIIGSHTNTTTLLNHFRTNPEDGYKPVAVVSSHKYLPADFRSLQYSSLKDALKTHPDADVIIQTDQRQSEYVYRQSIHRHLLYYLVPSNTTFTSQTGQPELIGSTPAILIKTTPLVGGARIVKRLTDLILGSLLLLLALPFMLLIFIIQKLLLPSAKATYSETRLSRYNRKVTIYKFRSMKPEFCGLSPEEAFKKISRPDLIKKYRLGGDFLDNDPRITKFGKFLRATSLDELPQLFNIVKGDISLVGPRALVPGELRNYGDRSLLLSVKSGLTGLAQVSGRRDISFEERRAIDLYYVQNWSIWLDLQIIFRTAVVVLLRKGAK